MVDLNMYFFKPKNGDDKIRARIQKMRERRFPSVRKRKMRKKARKR